MPVLLDFNLSTAGQVQVVQGSDADWTIQSSLTSSAHPVFGVTDTVSAKVYRGQDQALLFAPTTIWDPATGYATGLARVSPTAAQTALLEANGTYTLQVWWAEASPSTRVACIARRQLLVLPAPGVGTQTITTYNTYKDMLDIAGWLTMVQNSNADQEGFYSQRLQARTWMDGSILANYRGASVGTLEMHSTLAFNFGGGYGLRRSLGPSPSMIDDLAAGKLILRPQVVKACTHWAVSLVGLTQVGINNQLAQYGFYHQAMAEREAASIVAEIDLTGTGTGSIFVPLGVTNTVMT